MRKRKAKKEETTGTKEAQETQVDSQDVLRPVPENASKIIFGPKLFFTAIAFLLLGALVIKGQYTQKSQIQILTDRDKFKIEFRIKEEDQENASQLLQKLSLQKNITEGVEFELDSTSSAKLAFSAPITINLNPNPQSISFSGESHLPLIDAQLSTPSGFTLPKTTHVAVYGKDLVPMFLKNANVPQNIAQWFTQNLKAKDGQFLVSFEKGEFFLALKTFEKTNFSSLSELQLEDSQESVYKQETEDDVNVHIIKLPQEKTLNFFEEGEFLYVASSLESAKSINAAKKGNAPSLNFPKTKENIALAIFSKQNEASNNLSLAIFSKDAQKLEKYAKVIKESLLVVSGTSFDGNLDF